MILVQSSPHPVSVLKIAILMHQLVDTYVKESDLNTSLKDENLSKSNALFLDK